MLMNQTKRTMLYNVETNSVSTYRRFASESETRLQCIYKPVEPLRRLN